MPIPSSPRIVGGTAILLVLALFQSAVHADSRFVTSTQNASAQPSPLDYQSVWQCDSAKFNWYCDQEDDAPPETKQAPPPPPPPPKPKSIREMKTIEEFREELKRLLGVATMNPTDANVKAFIEANQVMGDKGSEFADVWRRVVWSNPNLDYSLRRPTNSSAISTFKSSRNATETRTISELAQGNGIFFFFKSTCPYCHQMASTLKMLQKQYGIEIFPVSLDGIGLPDFPNPKVDQRAAAALGVTVVPALFLGSKSNGSIAPIGYGTISLTEIVERIYVLTKTQPGQDF